MSKFIYFPLEDYPERYTGQMSRPVTGWVERTVRKAFHNKDFIRIEGSPIRLENGIVDGQVLDGIGRPYYAMSQVMKFLELLNYGIVKDSDILYFDDFFHPGIESIKYACHQKGLKVRMYSFLYAQSVDEFDFTVSMKEWMRPLEQAYGQIYDGIFVTNTLLKELCIAGGIGTPQSVFVSGLVYNDTEVVNSVGLNGMDMGRNHRKDRVVYSSRLDREKNPLFMLNMADSFLRETTTATFAITTSAKSLRSNQFDVVDRVKGMKCKWRDRFEIYTNMSKKDYYELLYYSKVQFNCANQDWVSFTLLDALTTGCQPVYPRFRSFPEVFKGTEFHLYEHLNEKAAINKVIHFIENDQLPVPVSIVKQFSNSMNRIIKFMLGQKPEPLYGTHHYE